MCSRARRGRTWAGGERKVSPDGKKAVFHLRKDAKFADGTPVTSADVAYTFKRAMLGPGYITALLPFVGVSKPEQIQAPDPQTFIRRRPSRARCSNAS